MSFEKGGRYNEMELICNFTKAITVFFNCLIARLFVNYKCKKANN